MPSENTTKLFRIDNYAKDGGQEEVKLSQYRSIRLLWVFASDLNVIWFQTASYQQLL